MAASPKSSSDEAVRAARPASIMDVAHAAGVSHQTVSRVLNASPNVRPSTRQRVLAAMEELRYRPNVAARALVTGRSQLIGVVTGHITDYGPSSTVQALEQAAHGAGYFLVLASVNPYSGPSLKTAVQRLHRQGVDGIVVIAGHHDVAGALDPVPEDTAVLVVEGTSASAQTTVSVNHFEGSLRATEHLLSLGHQTVWHVGGPAHWRESEERQRGWQTALKANDCDVPEVVAGDWSERSGYEIGTELARIPELTAVHAANDQMALGILRALYEAGRSVPGDVSIVGFDDIPGASYFWPPLTTVRQDFELVGRRALELLLAEVQQTSLRHQHVVIEPQLILRASTGRPAAARGARGRAGDGRAGARSRYRDSR